MRIKIFDIHNKKLSTVYSQDCPRIGDKLIIANGDEGATELIVDKVIWNFSDEFLVDVHLLASVLNDTLG